MASATKVNKERFLEILEEFLASYRNGYQEGDEKFVKIPDAAVRCVAGGSGKDPDLVARTLYRLREECPEYIYCRTVDWLVGAGMGRPDLLHTDLIVLRAQPLGAEDGPTKRCPGPLHQGQQVPITSFQRRSGARSKSLRSYCKLCDLIKNRSYRKAYEARHRKHKDWRYSGYVPFRKVEFALRELDEILGPTKAARLIEVSEGCIYRWLRQPSPKYVQKEYAARILQALLEVRNGNGFQKT